MTQFDEEPTKPGLGGNLRNILLAAGAGVIAVAVIGYASQPREVPDTTTTSQPPVVEEPEPIVTTTSPSEVTTSTTSGSVALTLRDYLPEVNGTLVAALSGTGGSRLLTWPANRPESTSVGLPEGAGPVLFFDVTDQLLAFLGPAIQRGGQTMYVGDTSGWEPLATDVTSFAWHATWPGRLAWVENGAGLCVAELTATGHVVEDLTCHPGVTGRLSGFDDLGVLMVDSGEVVRLTLDGDEVNRVPGTDASIGPDGRILVENRDPSGLPVLFGVAQPDLSDLQFLEWAPANTADTTGVVAWSPHASSPELAFLVGQDDARFQLQRWDLDGNNLNALNVGGRFWDIGWDPSGRYLLAPGFSGAKAGVLVYDLFSVELTYLPFEDPVQEAQIVVPAVCEDASHLQTDWVFRHDTSIDDLWMVRSRDPLLESSFLSGRITDGADAGEIATWILPFHGGQDPPQQSTPANDVALETYDGGFTFSRPEDHGLSSWMLLDGAYISQWCVTVMG